MAQRHPSPSAGEASGEGEPDGRAERASDTRRPGRRGQATRRRLLDTTARMLEESSYRDLRVVDIARRAQTSPATFYQYFGDVEDAVLRLAEEMEHVAGPELAALIRDHPWTADRVGETALGVADGFLEVWDRYRPLLRVVDLATDEGDERFRALRTRLLGQPAGALVEVIGVAGGEAGRDGDDVRARAGVLVSMLAHVAAHHHGLEQWGAGPAALRRSMADVLVTTVRAAAPAG